MIELRHPADLDAGLEDVRESIVAVAGDLRDLSHQLHPTMLALLGPIRALRALCEEFQRARGIETVFEASASDQDASEQAAMCLYRVLQESLMNIAKHSGSTSARVTLTRQADQLEMRVRDEGRGFIPGQDVRQGIGLTNIEERVRLLEGELVVNSKPGRGHRDCCSSSGGATSLKRSSGSHQFAIAGEAAGRRNNTGQVAGKLPAQVMSSGQHNGHCFRKFTARRSLQNEG